MPRVTLSQILMFRTCPMKYRFASHPSAAPPDLTNLQRMQSAYLRLVRRTQAAFRHGCARPEPFRGSRWEQVWQEILSALRPSEMPGDDFSWGYMITAGTSAAESWHGYLQRQVQSGRRVAGRAVDLPLNSRTAILRHRIQTLFMDPDGYETLRHRFGPASPRLDPGDPFLAADALAGMAVFRRPARATASLFPWHDKVLSMAWDPDTLDRWRTLLSEEADLLLTTAAFDPRPGDHCLSCGYRSRCPALQPLAGDPKPGIADTLLRFAHHYADTADRLKDDVDMLALTKTALTERMRATGVAEIRLSPHRRLRLKRSYHVPRRGSTRREELEGLLAECGYTGPVQGPRIAAWLTASPGTKIPRCQGILDRITRWRLVLEDPEDAL